MKRTYYLIKATAVAFSLLYMTSCKQMQEESPIADTAATATGNSTAEEAYPGETGEIKEGTLFGQNITYSEINNEAIFQGDIILSPTQLTTQKGSADNKNARTEAAGTALSPTRWTDGIIYYTIDRSLANKQIVLDAIAHVQSTTPIRFYQRKDQANYLTFKPSRGNSSAIGMVGGQQFITLGLGFTMGGVLHELGHTIGLLHEHTRSDRNNNIKVNLANVAPAAEPNFQTYQGFAGFDFGLIDFGSIMMMDSYAYSKNGLPTMTLFNGFTFTVQRNALSTQDVACITTMYARLYLMKNDRLFAINEVTGKGAEVYGGWSQSESVTSDENYIYHTRTGNLWKASKLNGKATVISTMTPGTRGLGIYKDNIYALSEGYLVKIHPVTGAKTQISGQYWLPATAFTYFYGFFYIVSGDILFRVTPETGVAVSIGSGYKGVTELTAVGGYLWTIKNNRLCRTTPMTGASFVMNEVYWNASTQMTRIITGPYKDNLFVVDKDNLYRVDKFGSQYKLSSGWSGAYQLTANDL